MSFPNQNSHGLPDTENKEFSSIPSGSTYRALSFESFSSVSNESPSSNPFEQPKYRSLGFDGSHGFPGSLSNSTHQGQEFHALNSLVDRAMGDQGDTAVMRPYPRQVPVHSPMDPKSVQWGQDADFSMPSMKKEMAPVGLGPKTGPPVYQHKAPESPLKQHLEQVTTAPPPPELPIQFEAFSSFWSASSSTDLWKLLLNALHGNPSLDLTFQAKRNKIKGVVMHNNYAVQFCLRIFSKPKESTSKWNQNAKHLVEFQRRSGDAFEFSAFFKQALETIRKLDKSAVLPDQQPVVAKSLPEASLPASLAPPSLSQKMEVNLDTDTRSALYSMAVAQNTESQREALRSLAALSASTPASSFLTPQDLGDDSRKSEEEISLDQVLQCALTSRDNEVRRCASTMLANLSRHKNAQPVMSSTLIQKMFALLEQEHLDADVEKPDSEPLPEYVTAETKRQITRAISGLAQIPATCKVMASQPDYVRILRQQTEQSADPRLTIYSETAVSSMLRGPREVVV